MNRYREIPADRTGHPKPEPPPERSQVKSGHRLSGVAAAFRETARQLDQREEKSSAQLMAALSEWIEDVSGMLHSRELGEVLREMGDITRRYPAFMLTAAAVSGFFLAQSCRRTMERPPEKIHLEHESTLH